MFPHQYGRASVARSLSIVATFVYATAALSQARDTGTAKRTVYCEPSFTGAAVMFENDFVQGLAGIPRSDQNYTMTLTVSVTGTAAANTPLYAPPARPQRDAPRRPLAPGTRWDAHRCNA